jgi:hypothetical protein
MAEFNRMVQTYVVDVFPGELRSREVSGGYAPYFAAGEINHVFLAKDYSDPGRKYNSLTYQLLRTWLSSPNVERINSISEFITQNLTIALKPHVQNLKSTELKFVDKNVAITEVAQLPPTNEFGAPQIQSHDLSHYGDFVVKGIREDAN